MRVLKERSAEIQTEDISLERAMVGGLALDAETWDRIGDRVPPSLFTGGYRPAIVSVIASLYRERIPVTPESVGARLRAQGLAQAEMELVAECVPVACITGALVEHYAQLLGDLWAKREARRIALQFLESPESDDTRAEIDLLQRRLALIEVGGGSRIVTAGDLVADMIEQLEDEATGRSGTELISTGFKSIDAVIGGFEPGVLQVYAARPGIGKSALTIAFARALGRAGVPTAVFWWEDAARKFALRVAAAEGDIPAAMLRHGKNMRPPWWDRLMATADVVAKWPVYPEPAKGLTGPQVALRMRRLVREKGVRVFLADHWGEVKLDRREHGDRTDLALGESLKVYRDEADALGACPVAFHQLGQKAESEKGGPRLGWLFNSDILGQAGRVVGFIGRKDRLVTVQFVKATYGEKDAKAELAWDPETMSIFEPNGPRVERPAVGDNW